MVIFFSKNTFMDSDEVKEKKQTMCVIAKTLERMERFIIILFASFREFSSLSGFFRCFSLARSHFQNVIATFLHFFRKKKKQIEKTRI